MNLGLLRLRMMNWMLTNAVLFLGAMACFCTSNTRKSLLALRGYLLDFVCHAFTVKCVCLLEFLCLWISFGLSFGALHSPVLLGLPLFSDGSNATGSPPSGFLCATPRRLFLVAIVFGWWGFGRDRPVTSVFWSSLKALTDDRWWQMALSLPPKKIGVFNLDSYPPVINCGWAIPGLNGGEKNGKINELNGGQVTTLKKMPCHVCHVVQCKERPFSILFPWGYCAIHGPTGSHRLGPG